MKSRAESGWAPGTSPTFAVCTTLPPPCPTSRGAQMPGALSASMYLHLLFYWPESLSRSWPHLQLTWQYRQTPGLASVSLWSSPWGSWEPPPSSCLVYSTCCLNRALQASQERSSLWDGHRSDMSPSLRGRRPQTLWSAWSPSHACQKAPWLWFFCH